MMQYTCPVCNNVNQHQLDIRIEEYVCHSCLNIIDANLSKKSNKPAFKLTAKSLALNTNSSGVIDGVEYFVMGVVIRKYGNSTFWREYYLKDRNGNSVFLSETDGHWILLFPQEQPLVEKKKHCEFKGKLYRWYETTPSSIHYAAGFFEDKIDFSLATYKEFVNGTEMVSWEELRQQKTYFWGKHIPKNVIKKNFKVTQMPNYSGIGVVQPYYFDIKQIINILGVGALLICILQMWVSSSRFDSVVFDEVLKYENIKNKEYVSKSFKLEGGSAPLKVQAYTSVDNSLATYEVNLINEKTNEVTSATKDIEYYHGIDGGERWSEGDQKNTFNFCGVAPGNYHLTISAEREKIQGYISSKGENIIVNKLVDGRVETTNKSTGMSTIYSDHNFYKEDSANISKQEIVSGQDTTQALDSNSATNISIKVEWLPTSLWNFFIVMIILIVIGGAMYFGRHYFNVAKWNNSSNSPY